MAISMNAFEEFRLIACYCRVSSQRQRNDSQKSEISRWLTNNRVDAAEVCWFEDQETGKTTDRPAFEQLQRAIFAGKVATIVVWKLDRISRRLQDGINLIADWCDRDVRVISVTQQIDLAGPVGRMMASVLFGLAEIELEYRRERQAAGIRVAKRRGIYQGRKPGTTKSNPPRAKELRQQGLTNREVAKALGVSERTISRYLQAKTVG